MIFFFSFTEIAIVVVVFFSLAGGGLHSLTSFIADKFAIVCIIGGALSFLKSCLWSYGAKSGFIFGFLPIFIKECMFTLVTLMTFRYLIYAQNDLGFFSFIFEFILAIIIYWGLPALVNLASTYNYVEENTEVGFSFAIISVIVSIIFTAVIWNATREFYPVKAIQ